MSDEVLARIFLEELERVRNELNYEVWAYVLMPDHVHMLVWPKETNYNISSFLNRLKGRTANRYRLHLQMERNELYESMLIRFRGKATFRVWQRGGGFDRNVWSGIAVHNSIRYIENNPVRAKLVASSDAWEWSSAFSRVNGTGVVPDGCARHVIIKNIQKK